MFRNRQNLGDGGQRGLSLEGEVMRRSRREPLGYEMFCIFI